MEVNAANIAQKLLEIKAVKLNPASPYTWASGWLSPIYCDNRLTLSYPEIRTMIRDGLIRLIREHFPAADAVAGVATAGIPHASLVADTMNLPLIYVRSKAKGHGMENLIEGRLESGKSYIVVEDLVSTGGSSLKAVEAIRAAGGNVAGMVAVFSYGFDLSLEKFRKAGLNFFALTNLEQLLQNAIENNYIHPRELESIRSWRQAPEKWGVKKVEQ